MLFYDNPKWLPLSILALLAAIVAAKFSGTSTSNLQLRSPGIGATYISFFEGSKTKCWMSNRRASTLRRSDTRPRRSSYSISYSSETTAPSILLSSKNEGVHLFVPCEKVLDWDFPFIQLELLNQLEQNSQCKPEWTTLFLSRRYQGLYLKTTMPYDLRKKHGGPDCRRAFVQCDDKGNGLVTCSRLLWPAEAFRRATADGQFPRLHFGRHVHDWALHSLCQPSHLIMDCRPPYRMFPLPLPFSLKDLMREFHGPNTSLPEFRDVRLSRFDAHRRKQAKSLFELLGKTRCELIEKRLLAYRKILLEPIKRHLHASGQLHKLDELKKTKFNNRYLRSLRGD